MDYIYEITSTIASIMPISFWDVIDVIALSYLIYKLINFMKETRAVALFKGIILLMGAYLLSVVLKMKVLCFLLKNAMDVGFFAIIVLFQPELRRTLEKLGHSRVSKLNVFSTEGQNETLSRWNTAIDAICDACEDLSATTTGALIVVEMETKLGEQIDNGTVIDAVPSKELFGTIFFPKTPLHDGAAIVRDGIVIAAGCFLPKPQNEERLDKKFGSRHRAAIGMSENSDALIVVVSEETGTISVAENGGLTRGFDRDGLKKYLRDHILTEKMIKADKPVRSSEKPEKKRFSFGKKEK